jgi:hypothetical protein
VTAVLADHKRLHFLTQDSVDQARGRVDSSWSGAFRAGGMCLFACGVIFLLVAAFSVVLGAAPTGGEDYLRALAAHPQLARLTFGMYAVADVLLVPAILALFVALKGLGKNPILIAVGLMGFCAAFDLAVTEVNSLALVSVSEHVVAAAGPAQRAAYLAAAAVVLTIMPIATFVSYFVSSAGLLLCGVIMLRGVFTKVTALLGIVAAAEGLAGAFYVVVPGLAVFLTPALVAYGLWGITGGARLTRLGRAALPVPSRV